MPKRKSSTGKLLSAGVLTAGLAAGGWFGWPYAYRWVVPAPDNKDVLTGRVERGDMEIPVTDRGELEAVNSVQVMCELEGGGKLVSIVPEGTRVKKDEEVARIDTNQLVELRSNQEVKVEQAEGKLKASQSEVDVTKNKNETDVSTAQLALTLAKIDFDSYLTGKYKVESDKLKAAVEKAKSGLRLAEDNLDYNKNLVRKGQGQMEAVKQKELEVQSSKFTLDEAIGSLDLLERVNKKRELLELESKATNTKRAYDGAVKSAEASNEKAKGELRASEKTLAIEKLALKRIDEQIARCVIKAPQDGIVIYYNRRYWDESSQVRPGATLHYQQTIFTLPDLSQMQVKVKVHESVVKRVEKDLASRMQTEALPGRILNGKVKTVGSVASSDGFRGGGVKEYDVVVTVDDLPVDHGLKPGMTAEVKIVLKRLTGVLQVPLQTVTEFGGKNVVYLVQGGQVERREIVIGDRNDTMIQILSGVSEGETLALDARTRAAADTKAVEKKPGETKPDEKKPETGSPTESRPATEAKAAPAAAGGT